MDFLHFVNRFYKQMCRWKSVKQIQHIYPLDQSYKVSLSSRCENDYIRGSGEIKRIQSISANICWVFTKHFHCQYCVWKYVYVWCWEVWSWHMLLRCRPGGWAMYEWTRLGAWIKLVLVLTSSPAHLICPAQCSNPSTPAHIAQSCHLS